MSKTDESICHSQSKKNYGKADEIPDFATSARTCPTLAYKALFSNALYKSSRRPFSTNILAISSVRSSAMKIPKL